MGLIQNLIKGMKGEKVEFKKKFKEAEENQKIDKILNERSKSSNERELDKYVKQQREDKIKNELDKIHKKQNKENWCSNSILKSQGNILKNDRPILKEKNIFKLKSNHFLK
jgi:hypothetical protein